MDETISETQISIVYAECNGFVEKRYLLSADYLFIVEVFWSDKRTTYIKRKYGEFLQFHKRLREYFGSKVAKEEFATRVFIPNINRTWPFQKATRDLAEKREETLHSFLKQLLQGNPMISSNKVVIDFFLPRPSDPVPYRNPPDGAVSDEYIRQFTFGLDDDENEDDILFER